MGVASRSPSPCTFVTKVLSQYTSRLVRYACAPVALKQLLLLYVAAASAVVSMRELALVSCAQEDVMLDACHTLRSLPATSFAAIILA